jgi:N-acetylglucosamine-6-phosphate deacetylase
MQVFTGASVFDGQVFRPGALAVRDGRVAGIGEFAGEQVALAGGILAPGLIDLQVNGGGGVMVDGSTDVAALAHVCAAHARLGATGLLPTLITDRPEATRR